MKLKNYSSGMVVRLAFSVMIQASADILLIDEVLAVGDASFQQKCLDVFYRLKEEGRTIVLVTHDMGSVEQFCDRALFLEDGDVRMLGDPEEVGRAYLAANFADASMVTTRDPGGAGRGQGDALGADRGRRRGSPPWRCPAASRCVHGSSSTVMRPVPVPNLVVWLEDAEGAAVTGAHVPFPDGDLATRGAAADRRRLGRPPQRRPLLPQRPV